MLNLTTRPFEWYGQKAAQNIWLHGLYLYGPSLDASDLTLWNPANPPGRSRLFATNVTFHGGTFGFAASQPAYLAGAQLALQRCLRLRGPVTATRQSVRDARERTFGHSFHVWTIPLRSLAPSS
jgi:hypothetical protein